MLNNLYKQNILSTQFNMDINQAILQHDLNRMAANSKDAKGLKAMYGLFDNDAATIAQCISRPNLVNKKTQNSYDWNNDIHKEIQEIAKSELQSYLATQSTQGLAAQENTVTFKLKDETQQVLELVNNDNQENIIELDKQEFKKKVQQLTNSNLDDLLPELKINNSKPKLQQKQYAFIYTEILEQTKYSIKVKNLVWQKQSLNKWLQSQEKTIQTQPSINSKLTLTKITANAKDFNKAGVTADTWRVENFPDGRYNHTAIWSGSEMIVWGGVDVSNTRLNTGGRYDPSTDSWLATSTNSVPSGRQLHTTIWSGSEMIIWGGNGASGTRLNTGGRYDPNTDSWLSTSTISAPIGRNSHTAIWSGSEMIVWGGQDVSNTRLNTGGRYDPSTDSWLITSTNSVPSGRYYHTAIWSGSEMIVWGGQDVSNTRLNTGGRYDPSTDSWLATGTPAAPSGRYYHTAIWSGSEMIVWGGYDASNTSLNTGARYDPSADSWLATSTTSAPSGRVQHTTIWSGNEMIVWGGYSAGNVNTGGRYDPSTDSWLATSTSSAPSGRTNHIAIWSGSEMIVWGGIDAINARLNTGGRYDPSTDSWMATSTPSAPGSRLYYTAIWSGSEMIVWGGRDAQDTKLNTGGRYDPSTDSWLATSTTAAPSGRYFHTAIWSGSEMIVWGGGDASNIRLNSGGRYNPNTDSWLATSPTSAPSGRNNHTAIWSGSVMIVWGGLDASNTKLNTGGRYDPSTDSWLATSTPSAPSGRTNHTAIWSGSEMIVWGGLDASNTKINTGGRYDPSTDSWLATGTPSAPSGRYLHTAIWSGSEMIVWGGDGVSGKVNTGGRYDPSTDSWLATSTTSAPSGRFAHTAIWSGSEMIIWGGNFINSMGIYYVNNSYTIAGNLTGLNGNQVIIQNNGGDNLTLTANGSFTFANAITEGDSYAVTVLTNPNTPAQTCTITNGSGTNIMTDVTNVSVNCVTNQYSIGVTVSGLGAGSVVLQNNGGDNLTISSNGSDNFNTMLDDLSPYAVTVLTQPTTPIQTCGVSGGTNNDGTGALAGANASVTVYCNTPPVTTANTYTAFEDIDLIANDADGSVAGVNDDSVLVNDSDVDADSLSVVNPDVFTAIGLGGEITLAADGTFSYVPPADVSGQDALNFNVSDGIHTVASSLSIDVLPVNDAPTFSIQGDVLNASAHPDFANNSLGITAYASNFVMGPADESSQSVAGFIPTIFADSNSVLAVNGVTVNNAGDLSLDFTSNLGVAIVRLQLQDDGVTTNGGEDTSAALEFVVSYNHLIFTDSFEETVVVKHFKYLNAVKAKSPLRDYLSYDYKNNRIVYKNHRLHLSEFMMTNEMMQVIQMWVDEIDKVAN